MAPGDDGPQGHGEVLSTRFADLHLRPDLQKSLLQAGYVTCTPIQEMSLNDSLAGHDVMGVAQTGTGKTVAFLVPIFQKLEPEGDLQALVICPTRELALQVGGEAVKIGEPLGVRTAVLYGGTSMGSQKQQLLSGVDLVVGTPGRLLDFISSAYLPTRKIRWLVLDEADRMLDMGFIDEVDKIIRRLPMSRQTLLFSATLPTPVLNLAHRYMLYPKEFRVDLKTQIPAAIAQVLYRVPAGKKVDLLRAVLRNEKPHKALIFTAKKDSTSEIARRLRTDGYEVYPLSSNLRQSDRERVLAGFRDGSIRLLVATDVAARGIDIDDISHVINFDLPMEAGDYVHRIGRTGRVERAGRAISLVEPRDMPTVRDIERLIGVSFAIEALPGFSAPGAVDAGSERPSRRGRPDRGGSRRGGASRQGAAHGSAAEKGAEGSAASSSGASGGGHAGGSGSGAGKRAGVSSPGSAGRSGGEGASAGRGGSRRPRRRSGGSNRPGGRQGGT